MLLKAITTAFVLLGIGLAFALPFIMKAKPVGEGQLASAQFGVRLLTYFGLTCAAWIGAAISALILARRTKREFVESQKENVRELVEGAIKDHERKS